MALMSSIPKTNFDELYKYIVTAIDNSIAILSPNGSLVWINDAFTKLTGYKMEDLKQVVHPLSKMISDTYLQRILLQVNQQKKSVVFEAPLTTKSDERKWLTSTITPLFENNQLKYFILLSTDMTSKKNAEERFFLLNSRLNTLKKIYKLIIVAQSFKEITNATLNDLMQISMNFIHCSFMMFDVSKNQAKFIAVSAKVKLSFDSGDEFPADSLASYTSLSKGMVKIVTDTRDITKPSTTDMELKNKGIQSYVMFPVMIQDQLVGSLNVCANKPNAFPQETIDVIREVGNALSVSVQQYQMRETINQKNVELEKKNKDITSSIIYAKRIQQAILPTNDLIFQTLKNSFVLYKPRDIVSGDFYFFAEKKDKVIIGAVDCTGHGVPGAFMSLIGNDLLTQIVVEKGITQPAEILNQLNTGLRGALKQLDQEAETKDGMDIALCTIDLTNQQLEFAGAYRPLYLFRKAKVKETVTVGSNETQTESSPFEFREIKGNRFPVAGFHLAKERIFENFSIKYRQGDTFYLFTDGYADQFGGPNGKTKFMTKRFKQTLLSIQHLTMKEQEQYLENLLEEWKGGNNQIDDVLVMGVRL